MSRYPAFTGTISRLAFIQGNRQIRHELIIEIYDAKNVFTFIAYGQNAILLNGFLNTNQQFTIDYAPHSSGEFDGEALSARDRNE